MKYTITATALAVTFGLWQSAHNPALAFLGFAAALVAAVGYAANRGGIRG